MRLHKYLFNKMAVHLMEWLSQRNLYDAANLTKLNTRCPPSCNCEFLKEHNLHYVLGWHLLCYCSWSTHAQSMPLHNSAKVRRCPSKISDALCDCQLSLYRNDFYCMQAQKFRCVCGLSSSSSPLFLGQAVLQYMYEKSIYSSLTFVILSHVFSIQVSISRLEVDRKVCQLPYYNALLYTLSHSI